MFAAILVMQARDALATMKTRWIRILVCGKVAQFGSDYLSYQ
jgi:hypothetical protein